MKTALLPAALATACLPTMLAIHPALADETILQYPNNTLYVAVNNSDEEGVVETGTGSYHLGNGSYVITGDGDPTDCGKQPDTCKELLEEADASGEPQPLSASNAPDGLSYQRGNSILMFDPAIFGDAR